MCSLPCPHPVKLGCFRSCSTKMPNAQHQQVTAEEEKESTLEESNKLGHRVKRDHEVLTVYCMIFHQMQCMIGDLTISYYLLNYTQSLMPIQLTNLGRSSTCSWSLITDHSQLHYAGSQVQKKTQITMHQQGEMSHCSSELTEILAAAVLLVVKVAGNKRASLWLCMANDAFLSWQQRHGSMISSHYK